MKSGRATRRSSRPTGFPATMRSVRPRRSTTAGTPVSSTPSSTRYTSARKRDAVNLPAGIFRVVAFMRTYYLAIRRTYRQFWQAPIGSGQGEVARNARSATWLRASASGLMTRIFTSPRHHVLEWPKVPSARDPVDLGCGQVLCEGPQAPAIMPDDPVGPRPASRLTKPVTVPPSAQNADPWPRGPGDQVRAARLSASFPPRDVAKNLGWTPPLERI